MNNTYIVLKEGETYYPMAFITGNDEIGKMRAEKYKLENDEKMVVVTFVEVN